MAMEVDNCPDNVCASLSGGLTYSFVERDSLSKNPRLHYFCEAVDDPDFRIVALVPEFMLPTDEARNALKDARYEIDDVAFNISRSTCIPAIFRSRHYELLKHAMEDRIHQEQRGRKFYRRDRKDVRLESIFKDIIKSGAYGACISGAGSTLAVFCDRAVADVVRKEFRATFERECRGSLKVQDVYILKPDNDGVRVSASRITERELPADVATWMSRAPHRAPLVIGPMTPLEPSGVESTIGKGDHPLPEHGQKPAQNPVKPRGPGDARRPSIWTGIPPRRDD